ncbi:MAG: DUF3109 family protein [Bacteroidota bacterium]
MLIVQDILISDDVVKEAFACNLSACKGACCWEGDYGAPLEAAELSTLEQIYPTVKNYLSEESRRCIEREGLYTYYTEPAEYGTPLLENGACAYLIYDELGIAKCGIEQAYRDGAIDFYKPISCHLYPIRVNSNKAVGFEALNYDQWDICSAACQKGQREGIPLYRFAKTALIRKYGADFYEELEAAVEYAKQEEE